MTNDWKALEPLARQCGFGEAYGVWHADIAELTRFAALVRDQALEEAAEICDSVNNIDNPMTSRDCADTIRALKEAK